MELKRSYFSAFIPVAGTSLGAETRTPLMREHRLYQCDFLMRKYGFELKEFIFDEEDKLDLKLDPKMSIAMQNRDLFPMEINEADYKDLIKVPGIGPQSAMRILKVRDSGHRFTKMRELKNMGLVLKRASSFISINGNRQTNLFDFQDAPTAC